MSQWYLGYGVAVFLRVFDHCKRTSRYFLMKNVIEHLSHEAQEVLIVIALLKRMVPCWFTRVENLTPFFKATPQDLLVRPARAQNLNPNLGIAHIWILRTSLIPTLQFWGRSQTGRHLFQFKHHQSFMERLEPRKGMIRTARLYAKSVNFRAPYTGRSPIKPYMQLLSYGRILWYTTCCFSTCRAAPASAVGCKLLNI